MTDSNIPFQVIDWSQIQPSEHTGESGTAFWQTSLYDGLRVRIVEYSPNYIADHWCQRGHIVHCLEGEFISEMADGSKHLLTKGKTYIVSDDMSSHRSITGDKGVKLLIIDGDFLKLK